MAPRKAPDISGPSGDGYTGKIPEKTPLTPRQLHEIVLRVVSLAALAEGPTVQAGSRTERKLHDIFRRIDGLVDRAEGSVPLADLVDSKGNVIAGFRLEHFDVVSLEEALRSICTAQKKLMGRRSFDPAPFTEEVFLAFARAGLPVRREKAASIVQRILTRERHHKPSIMAGVILQEIGLPGAREVQNLKRLMPAAREARGTLRRNDLSAALMATQEFLTCLQIPSARVVLESSLLQRKRQKRRKSHGDYSLREAMASGGLDAGATEAPAPEDSPEDSARDIARDLAEGFARRAGRPFPETGRNGLVGRALMHLLGVAHCHELREGQQDAEALALLDEVVDRAARHMDAVDANRKKSLALVQHDLLAATYRQYRDRPDMSREHLGQVIRDFFAGFGVTLSVDALSAMAPERKVIAEHGGPVQFAKLMIGRLRDKHWKTIHNWMKDGNSLDPDPPLAFGRRVTEMEIVRYTIRHAANRASKRLDLARVIADASKPVLVALGALPAPDGGEVTAPAVPSEDGEETDKV